jgi:hypothetical protein
MSVSAAQQIANWLEKLALGQYAQCFAENEIDFSILGDRHIANITCELGPPRRSQADSGQYFPGEGGSDGLSVPTTDNYERLTGGGPKPFSPQNTSPKWSGTFQSVMFARLVR